MAQRTKKQHIVPRFYLSKFSDADGLVWSYTAKKQPLGRKPEATAVETNFYSPIGPDGQRFDEAETYLGTIESAAAPLWDAVSEGNVLSGEDRDKIALFLAAQYLRSPSTIRAGAEMVAYVMQQTAQSVAGNKEARDQSVDAYEIDTGQKITPEERDKKRAFIGKPDKFSITVRRDAGLPILDGIENLAKIFFNMKWVVGRSKDQHLITSDCPVIRTSDPATHSRIYGDGAFSNKTVRVSFPLSPDRMLEMTWHTREQDRVVEIPRQLARVMNRRRAAQAERFLYCNQKDVGIVKLSDKWLNQEKAPMIATSQDTPKSDVKRKL